VLNSIEVDSLMTDVPKLQKEFLQEIQEAPDLVILEKCRVDMLGKQGVISQLMKTLGNLAPEERKIKGAEYNNLRQVIIEALDAKKSALEGAVLAHKLEREKLDITLPPRAEFSGVVHPLSQVIHEVTDIFERMGFWFAEGPDIEDEFYNFSALNIPEDHPTRQEQDTFYLPSQNGKSMLLRTQTSPVQIRTMMVKKPPVRIIALGRVYRSDYDATHTPTFHQVEALFIDKGIHMGHLKSCLTQFCRTFFELPSLEVRFRPSYFPFTEPSAEVDIACTRKGNELIIGGEGGWLEILGAGMVHPNVLRACGIDPEQYQGFAFGMGIERVAMLKYGIPDLRSFYDTDLRWLRHYGFNAFEALMKGAML
jgi:phenylalanyl-tRNA synthetase alpha chain